MTDRQSSGARGDGLNVLLIAGHRARAALLRQAMEQTGVSCVLRRIDPGRAATAYARRSGMYRRMPDFDVIFLDVADTGRESVDTLRSLLGGAAAPLVLLTRPAAEGALAGAGIVDLETSVFAPCDLQQFLLKMRDHRRRRFLRALSVMSQLGPVLVRLPCTMSARRLDRDVRLTA